MFFFLVVEPADVGLVVDHGNGEKEQISSAHAHGNVGPAGFSESHDEEVGLVRDPEPSLAVSTHVDGGTESSTTGDEEEGLLQSPGEERESPIQHGAVGFVQAWNIPGVAPFAFCLFFSKLVAYTFLNWLPFYITQTSIGLDFLFSRVLQSRELCDHLSADVMPISDAPIV